MTAWLDAIALTAAATPDFLMGFAVNITVAIGATLGALVVALGLLGMERLSRPTRWISHAVCDFIKLSPTFIMLILLFGVMPRAVEIGGTSYAVPTLPVAILALILSGAAYFTRVLRRTGDDEGNRASVFACAVFNCLLMQLMASGITSYVGVPDVVSRTIALVDLHGATLPISLIAFGWVMVWFAGVSLLAQRFVARVLHRKPAAIRTAHAADAATRAMAVGCGDADAVADANVAALRGVLAEASRRGRKRLAA